MKWWTIGLIQERLQTGGDLEELDSRDQTALMFASKEGNEKMVKELVQKGADIQRLNVECKNALFFAIENQSLEIVTFFIELGINIHQYSNDGLDSLQLATMKNQTSLALQLIELGVRIEPVNNNYPSALIYAFENNNQTLINQLVEKGADVNFHDISGRSALSASLKLYLSYGNQDVFNYLLTKNPDPNILFKEMILIENFYEDTLLQKYIQVNYDSLLEDHQNEWKKYRLKNLLS